MIADCKSNSSKNLKIRKIPTCLVTLNSLYFFAEIFA